jgi:hypothetical protein
MASDEFQRLVARFREISDRYALAHTFEEKKKLTAIGKELARKARNVLQKEKKRIQKSNRSATFSI